MSTRDKKLLIILAGIAILAMSYFFIFSPQAEKREELQMENMSLKSQYNELSILAAKADDYTKSTQDMSDAMEQIYDNFSSYLQIEDGIMDAVEIEKTSNTKITELTIGSPAAVDVSSDATGDGSTSAGADNTTDSSDANTASTDTTSTDSSTSGSADTTSTDSATSDSTGSASSNSNSGSAVSYYQLYDVNTTMAFTTEYHGLKTMIEAVVGASQRKTISTLDVSFDSSTGLLTGQAQVDSYFLYGLDKPYQAPQIPEVPHGTDNLFGTMN